MKTFSAADFDHARYWAKVQKGAEHECWVWLGGKVKSGYGTFTIKNRTFLAHHVALVLDGRMRPEPPNHLACHGDCSNPSCVNPKHLRWDNQKSNISDVHRLGRAPNTISLVMRVAKLTEAEALAILHDTRNADVIASDYGVWRHTIQNIKRGRTWKHLHRALPSARTHEAPVDTAAHDLSVT